MLQERKQKCHSNARDMEANQGPSKLWYELLALHLMQFPGMWLNDVTLRPALSQAPQLPGHVF